MASSTILRDREASVLIALSEEVLISKNDLEDSQTRMAELETHVGELTMQHEYQLRLKDLTLNEKIKELTEKFMGELEESRARHQYLLQEHDQLKATHEKERIDSEEGHQRKLQQLEAQYQKKIMDQIERYKLLVKEKARKLH
eukprot:scaffold2162_cov398-Prasinococcus_capsulatus_cf.AAC.7